MINRNLNFENAKIVLRDFAGNGDKFRPKGRRKFNVLLTPEQAKQLAEDGWNIKWFKPKSPEDAPQAHMEVSVAFENVPPKIYMVTSRRKTPLNEETVGQLDVAEISNVDLTVRPYNWTVNGKSGVKAYVHTMYVTIVEDDFASKYETIDDYQSPPFDAD